MERAENDREMRSDRVVHKKNPETKWEAQKCKLKNTQEVKNGERKGLFSMNDISVLRLFKNATKQFQM